MTGFIGFVELGDDLTDMLQTQNSANVPYTAPFMPTFRIYGPNPTVPMTNGTGDYTGPINSQLGLFLRTHNITAANGYERGKTYTIVRRFVLNNSPTYTAQVDIASFTVV